MTDSPYLLFNLGAVHFGVDAFFVQEMFRLPAIATAAEMPRCIEGVMNLRGDIIPMMDLNVRMGRPAGRWVLDDMVIVLEHEGLRLGMIVNGVQEVCTINVDQVDPAPLQAGDGAPGLVAGMAGIDTDAGAEIVMLLDAQTLIRVPHLDDLRCTLETVPESHSLPQAAVTLCQNPGSPHAEILRERARALAMPPEDDDSSVKIPMVVVALNPERFAIPIGLVREFITVPDLAPIPCCPPHIVGALNLRGEILTVVDIHGSLQMPPRKATSGGKVMVVEVDHIRAGVLVDQAVDVVYLGAADLGTIPAAVKSLPEEYIDGTAPYAGESLSILNIPRIFARDGWIVKEFL